MVDALKLRFAECDTTDVVENRFVGLTTNGENANTGCFGRTVSQNGLLIV